MVDLTDKAEVIGDAALERGKESYDRGEEVVRDEGWSVMKFTQQGQETVKDAGRSAKTFAKRPGDMAREQGIRHKEMNIPPLRHVSRMASP